jgi:hypothetical protein
MPYYRLTFIRLCKGLLGRRAGLHRGTLKTSKIKKSGLVREAARCGRVSPGYGVL